MSNELSIEDKMQIATEWWSGKYPNQKQLCGFPLTEEGKNDVIHFMKLAGFRKNGIDNFDKQQTKKLQELGVMV